jgi:phosphohistidine phosphatase
MLLYLMRHAAAESRSSSGRDEDRILTPDGKQELKKVLAVLQKAAVRPAIVVSSPYTRARETATLAASTLNGTGEILNAPSLEPDSTPVRVWEEFRQHHREDSVLMTTHEPLISAAAAWMLGSSRIPIHFSTSTIACIQFDNLFGAPAGTLRWLMSPDLAPRE